MDESRTRAILARNLRRLIDHSAARGEKVSVRAWAIKRELDVRLITRLVKETNSVTLDTLDEVAEACGLKAWQLLLEDFDPAAPPEAPISNDERVILRRLRAILDNPQK